MMGGRGREGEEWMGEGRNRKQLLDLNRPRIHDIIQTGFECCTFFAFASTSRTKDFGVVYIYMHGKSGRVFRSRSPGYGEFGWSGRLPSFRKTQMEGVFFEKKVYLGFFKEFIYLGFPMVFIWYLGIWALRARTVMVGMYVCMI